MSPKVKNTLAALLGFAFVVAAVVLPTRLVVQKLDAIYQEQVAAKANAGGPALLGALPSGNGATDGPHSMSTVPCTGTGCVWSVNNGAASAALGDATTNPTVSSAGAYAFGFNGTTWDRARSGLTGIGTVFTGMLNTLPSAIYNSTPATRTNGQRYFFEADATGNLRQAEQFAPQYEDNTAQRALVEQRCTNYYLNGTSAGVTVKSGAGYLYGAAIGTQTASAVITIYDNTAASGTVLCKATLPAALLTDGPIEWNGCRGSFSTGLEVVVATANADLNLCYR